jgi:uncharacterized protein YkwD
LKGVRAAAVVLAALAAAATPLARADLLAEVNAIRARGCGRSPAAQPALRHEAALDRAAAAIADGKKLRDAMAASGYRALRSASLEAEGESEAAIARALAARGCKEVTDAAWRDTGFAIEPGRAIVVLAAPLVPPAEGDAAAVGARVLALVNEARSRPRRCGWKKHGPAPPLAASTALDRAALAHARDMATHSAMGHAGSDGSTPSERATRAGYRWRLVAENVAAGQPTPEQAVAEWLESPGHCANLMNPGYTEMGIGFAADANSAAGVYWSQLFATPAP